MAREVQDIVFGVAGQLLVFDAPEGRPSSVTSVQVLPWDYSDDDELEAAISGSPSVEANPNTTTDAAAGAGQANPRRVPLAATTGCAAGRTYLLVGTDQLRELVEVVDVDAGDAVIGAARLHNPYASGAAFVSTRIQATVDTDWCSDDRNLDTEGPNPGYRVRWVYVVAGVTYVADGYFNLVRYPGQYGVTPKDVDALLPGWISRLPVDHQADEGRRLIATAYREVKFDLHVSKVDDAAVANTEAVDLLVLYRTVELSEWARLIAQTNGSRDSYDVARDAYHARLNSLVKLVTNVPLRDETGAAAPANPLSLSRR